MPEAEQNKINHYVLDWVEVLLNHILLLEKTTKVDQEFHDLN